MGRIKSDYDDFGGERLANRLWDKYGSKIEDVNTFNEYYDKYLTNNFKHGINNEQDTTLRQQVFGHITRKHKSVIGEISLTSEAGKHRKKFPKIDGKMKIDGDREAGIIITKEVKPKYTFRRFVKNKPVDARQMQLFYTVKGEKYVRVVYRDRLGRFTSGKSTRTNKGIKLNQVV